MDQFTLVNVSFKQGVESLVEVQMQKCLGEHFKTSDEPVSRRFHPTKFFGHFWSPLRPFCPLLRQFSPPLPIFR